MGSLEKYTSDQVGMMCAHNGRTHENYSNQEIDRSRTHLNYKLSPDHIIKDPKTDKEKKLSDYDYFQKRIGETYLYGRGTKREDKAVTAAGWIFTVPAEIIGDPEKEKAFFKYTYQFLENRYGKENVISAHVHYDEGGAPHMHFLFIPVTDIDHDKIQFKTRKTKNVIQKDSGRYEFEYKFVLDKNGEKIPLNNYNRLSDYYDQKISGADVLCRVELKNIHSDLASFLKKNGVEGKVLNGATSGLNISVKEMKAYTKETGQKITSIKDLDRSKNLLENFLVQQEKAAGLEKTITEKNITIDRLQSRVIDQQETIKRSEAEKAALVRDDRTRDLTGKLSGKENEIRQKDQEIARLNERVSALEKQGTSLERKAELITEEKEKEISSLKDQLSSKDRNITHTKNASLNAEARLHEKESEITDLKHEISSLREKNELLENSIKEKDEELSLSKQADISSEKTVSFLEEKISSLESQIRDKDEEISVLKEENLTLESERSQLVEKTSHGVSEAEVEHSPWGSSGSFEWGSDVGWGTNENIKNKDVTM